jgi:hypothetical protein
MILDVSPPNICIKTEIQTPLHLYFKIIIKTTFRPDVIIIIFIIIPLLLKDPYRHHRQRQHKSTPGGHAPKATARGLCPILQQQNLSFPNLHQASDDKQNPSSLTDARWLFFCVISF